MQEKLSVVTVGLAGRKRSGKDTLARLLKERLQPYHHVVFLRFAGPLKELLFPVFSSCVRGAAGDEALKTSSVPFSEASRLIEVVNRHLSRYGLPELTRSERKTLKSLAGKPLGEAYRRALQYVGTDVFRKRQPDFWLDRFKESFSRTVERHKAYGGSLVVIVPDVRFPEEAQLLRHLSRAVILKVQRLGVQDRDVHPSEESVERIKPDFLVQASSVDELRAKAKRLAAIVDIVQTAHIEFGAGICRKCLLEVSNGHPMAYLMIPVKSNGTMNGKLHVLPAFLKLGRNHSGLFIELERGSSSLCGKKVSELVANSSIYLARQWWRLGVWRTLQEGAVPFAVRENRHVAERLLKGESVPFAELAQVSPGGLLTEVQEFTNLAYENESLLQASAPCRGGLRYPVRFSAQWLTGEAPFEEPLLSESSSLSALNP